MVGVEYIKNAVSELMGSQSTGHDTEHVFRVYNMAMNFCEVVPDANRDLVAAAALLHDCDDYKLFGEESARLLTNTHRILNGSGFDPDFCSKCVDIVKTIGYSKRLTGIMPFGIEGAIVSDADMCDAIGSVGIVRCIEWGAQYKAPFFDPTCLPQEVDGEKYKKVARHQPIINHFFDKLLRLRELCLTKPGRACAAKRHETMVVFLENYFDEVKAPPSWTKLLENYK